MRRVLRILIVCGLAYLTFWGISNGLKGANPVAIMGYMLLGLAGLIATILVTVPELVIHLAERFSRIFTNIGFPSEQASKPPLNYLLAREYARQMRYGDAIAEYQKIIFYYRQEQSAYEELIAVCKAAGANRLTKKYAKLYRRRFGCDLSA